MKTEADGVAIKGMRLGVRAARNELIKDVMCDYGYLEHMGPGVPREIIRGMWEFDATVPGFRLGDESVAVVLLRAGAGPGA